jgi:hypothetical protein
MTTSPHRLTVLGAALAALVMGACATDSFAKGDSQKYDDGSTAHRYLNGVTEFVMPDGSRCFVLYAGSSSALACVR